MGSLEEYCSYNASNDPLRERNFISICLLTEQLIHSDADTDGLGLVNEAELPPLMREIFHTDSEWID